MARLPTTSFIAVPGLHGSYAALTESQANAGTLGNTVGSLARPQGNQADYGAANADNITVAAADALAATLMTAGILTTAATYVATGIQFCSDSSYICMTSGETNGFINPTAIGTGGTLGGPCESGDCPSLTSSPKLRGQPNPSFSAAQTLRH